MAQKQFSGVTAAVLTPRLATGEVDVVALRKLLAFLLEKGIGSFALNGTTGEYALTDETQLRTLLAVAKEVTANGAQILCGVGAANAARCIAYAQIAQEANVAGLLLPMPFFFPYQQDDLEVFCRTVAATVTTSVLLYNLPLFTTPLQKETAATLIREVPNIVGIKDSSGSLDTLVYLSQQGIEGCRIVGDDSILAAALQGGHCDGVVSGVAGVAPELILALYELRGQCTSVEFNRLSSKLAELIEQLRLFPTPWALKWIAQARFFFEPAFPLPLPSRRVQQGEKFMQWFRQSGL